MKKITKLKVKYFIIVCCILVICGISVPTLMRYHISITANVVGYAKETRSSTYNIIFHSNGGTGTMAQMTVNYNEAVNLNPNTFTNDPSHFAGWNTQADGQGTNYSDEQEIIETDYITGNQIDLYAKWAQGIAEVDGVFYQTLQAAVSAVPDNEQKTVRLLADTEEQVTINKLQSIVFDLQEYTVSKTTGKDAVFQNYGTIWISNGTLTSSIDGAVLNLYPGSTAYVSGGRLIGTSTAKGQAIYNKGGTLEISGTAYLSCVSTNRPTVHHLDNGTTQKATTRILGGTIIATGYYAVGNEKSANAIEIGSKDGNVSTTTPVIQGATYGISSYGNNAGRFKFYDGIIKGKTAAISDEATVVNDVETYCEIGHSQETIDNQTYQSAYLQTIANARVVTFNPTGGTVSEPTRRVLSGDPIGALPTPTREGYIFNGWYTLSEGGQQIDATTVITADVEYFAQWEQEKIVTFNPNGGTVSEQTRNVIGGNPVGTLPIPTREGYIFNGWFTLSEGGQQIDATTIVTADVEYFAQWEKEKIVTFNPNGGTVSEPTRNVVGGNPVGTLPIPTRVGYVFDGWFTLSEGGQQIDATTIITADVEYFAHWIQAKVVTFNPNGGTVSEPTRSILAGNPVGTLPTPTRDEYTFIGWFTLSDGGDQIDANTIITADVEYFAHWRQTYYAQIGNNKYTTLSAAINAVPSNVQTTITLLQNNVGSYKITNTKNIILDLNGYTLSVEENKTVIENNGTLLITNGSISSTQATGTINNMANAVLRITDGNYSSTQRAVVYNTDGTVEISGGTFTSNATGKPDNTLVQRATIQNVGTNGTVTITGGTIIGTAQHAVSGDGPIIIGTKDSSINSTSPVIRGKQYGVWASGTLDFYDGIIKGVTDPIYGTITDTETNSTQVTGTETIGSDTYNTLHLE